MKITNNQELPKSYYNDSENLEEISSLINNTQKEPESKKFYDYTDELKKFSSLNSNIDILLKNEEGSKIKYYCSSTLSLEKDPTLNWGQTALLIRIYSEIHKNDLFNNLRYTALFAENMGESILTIIKPDYKNNLDEVEKIKFDWNKMDNLMVDSVQKRLLPEFLVEYEREIEKAKTSNIIQKTSKVLISLISKINEKIKISGKN